MLLSARSWLPVAAYSSRSPRSRQRHAGGPASSAPGCMPPFDRRCVSGRRSQRLHRDARYGHGARFHAKRRACSGFHCLGDGAGAECLSLLPGRVHSRRLPAHTGSGGVAARADPVRRLVAGSCGQLRPSSSGEIVERLSGRRTCSQCKAVYHITRQPSRVEGACDRCSGRLFQREDDRPEAITVRMEAYERSTAPLINFYGELRLLVTIPATGTPDEICARTITALEKRDIRS